MISNIGSVSSFIGLIISLAILVQSYRIKKALRIFISYEDFLTDTDKYLGQLRSIHDMLLSPISSDKLDNIHKMLNSIVTRLPLDYSDFSFILNRRCKKLSKKLNTSSSSQDLIPYIDKLYLTLKKENQNAKSRTR